MKSEHGTYARYATGCRCWDCMEANALYKQSRVDYWRKHPLAADDRRHGTINGYRNYSCRCRDCTTAHAVSMSMLRATKASAA